MPVTRPAVQRFVLAATFVATLLAMTWYLLQALSPYPDIAAPPDEARRVVHPDGFSIVLPPNTYGAIEVTDASWPASIGMRPVRGRSRYYPGLHVLRRTARPDLR